MKNRVLEYYRKLSDTQIAFWLFALSILIKGVSTFFLLETRGISLIADAADYIQYAEYMLDQGPFVWDVTGLEAHSGPGLPWLLYINYLVVGKGSYGLFLVINTIVNALSPVVIFFLGYKLTKRRGVALITSLWLIAYVSQTWFAPLILKESIVFLLFPLSLYILLRYSEEQSNWSKTLGFFLLAYGYLIHADERYFFYLPFLLVVLVTTAHHQKWLKVGVVCAGVLVVMTPWLVRNYMVYDRPIVLTERTAKFTDAIFGYDEPIKETRKVKITPTKEHIDLYIAWTDSIKKGLEVKTQNVKYLTGIAKGIENGQEPYPYSFVQRKLSYFNEFWRPYRFKGGFYGSGFRYMDPWSTLLNGSSILQYGLLLPFFFLGCFIAIRQRNRGVIILLAVILVQCFIHVFMAHAISRYRYPIDGMIFLIAFFGIATFFLRKKTTSLHA